MLKKFVLRIGRFIKYRIFRTPTFEQRHINYEYDRFRKYALGIGNENYFDRLDTQLKIYIHIIEKGFSFRTVKKGFGKEKLIKLIALLNKCEEKNNFSESYYKAIRVLSFYCNYAKENNINIDFIPEKYRDEKNISDVGCSVFKTYNQLDKMNFYDFAHSRHSFRYFSEKKIPVSDIVNAVKLAQTSPSACNRESVKVYCITDPAKICSLLDIQEGAKGFENVSAIFLIASDLSRYTYIKEYSTAYVDSGIFMMNLMYALNYYKIASCPLLFDDSEVYGGKLRQIVDVPKGEIITGMIASGLYYEDNVKFAKSARQDVKNILKIYKEGNL